MMLELKQKMDDQMTDEFNEYKLQIDEQCEKDKQELKETTIQNFNSQTTVISSQWKIKCQNELTTQMEDLHAKCKDEK